MQKRADVIALCRRSRRLVLVLPLALIGCTQQPVPQQQQPRSASAVCEQEARRLGFIILEIGPSARQPDGAEVVPILVKWGNDGAADVRCRYDSTYGATLG